MWNPVLISTVVHMSTCVLVVINQRFPFVILYVALSIDPDGLLPSQVPFFSMCALYQRSNLYLGIFRTFSLHQ
jgi:hypothetical protein